MTKHHLLRGVVCLLAALSCSAVWAEVVAYNINASTGSFSGSGNYHSMWSFTATESNPAALTLTATANDMNSHADGSLQLHSGKAESDTYTISVPDGYLITGFSFKYSFGNSGTATDKVLTIDGNDYTVTSSEQSLSIRNHMCRSLSFVLNGSNQPVKLTDFVVNIESNDYPQEGVYYRFSYDYGTAGVKYLQSTASGVSGASNALLMSESKGEESLFTIEHVNGNLFIKSYSTGKYLKEDSNTRGLQATGGNVTFAPGNTAGKIKIKATSYLHANIKNSTYFVDHCGTDGCNQHNFSFEEVPQHTLTVTGGGKANATVTWNGETKTFPATWTVHEGVVVENSELTIIANSAEYTFAGLTEGGNSLGETVVIESLTADRTITANFVPEFFSSTYGEKWVRLRNCSNNNYCATMETAVENGNGKTAVLDFADENQLWCLVGNAEQFKLYNKAAGESLMLSVPLSGKNTGAAQGDPAVLSASESIWKLKEQDYGYALVPTSNTNTSELGINMWAGAGGYLKLYSTASSNSGSYWNVQLADVANPLNFSVYVDGEAWSNQLGVADLQFTVNGVTNSTHITESIAERKMYLPIGATFSLSNTTYRGYTFNGFDNAELDTELTLPEGGMNITASYSANDERYLYYTPTNGKPYRIPAIATAPNGHIFAISDYRPCGNDIGYGEVDIKCRISTDNGKTWSEEFFVADGQGGETNEMTTGFGDAAIVADCEQNKLLIMMVCGKTVCHNGRWDTSKIGDADATAVNRVARAYATYNEETNQWDFTDPVEVTDEIYSLFLDGTTPTVTSMFIGSGKICQSRVVKKGEYYRLYCSMWTRDQGNRVIYSDDFGQSWNVLGSISDRPASSGDEPKVEELPDGTVLLSSRKGGGRYFNLFAFSDESFTTGSWATVASSNDQSNGLSFGGNSTNGEVLLVEGVNRNGEVKKIMLQSVPTGSGRSNVAIFYKEIDETPNAYTPITISQNWTKGIEVSQRGSAYSTMVMQADGRIAFLFEEEPGAYCIVYIPMSVETVTGGAYCGVKAGKLADAAALLDLQGVGYPKLDAESRRALQDAIDACAHDNSLTALSTLESAVAAYSTSTVDIQMPEDGKAYVFRNVHPGGQEYLMKFNGSTLAMDAVATGNLDAEKFICRIIDADQNKYAFVNPANGKFIVFYGQKSGNKSYAADNGAATGFASSFNVLGNSECEMVLNSHAETCMGTFSIAGKRNATTSDGYATMTISTNGNMDANGGSNNPVFSASYSSLFKIEQVSYENAPTFWYIEDDVTGAEYGQPVATFSAPFPTVIPDGVGAYYAEEVNLDNATVTMVLLPGQAIPANQGVILLSKARATSALMIPATTETATDISALNKLVPTAENQTIEAGNYVFGWGNFNLLASAVTMDKNMAYLSYEGENKPEELVSKFQSDSTVGIQSVLMPEDNYAVIYDLQGRKVINPVKGQLYIQNGHKFIQR